MSPSKTILTCLFTFLFVSNVYAVTLMESFNSALLNNETDNINESKLKQSLEVKSINQGTYLPTLSARGTYLKQENTTDQKAVGLNLTTSLYNGGRDSNLVEKAEAGITIAKNQKQLDRVTLFMDVVESYYTYLLDMNDIKNLELLKKQSQERADEIRKRVSIGRSRRGELLQAEAQLASVEAERSAGLGLLKQSEAKLSILTGLKKSELSTITVEQPTTAKSLDEYLSLALNREDIQNKELSIKQIQSEVSSAKSHFLPKLDLASNWYALKEGGSSSSSKDSDWDVGLTLTIPLFEGGVSQAKVGESVERRQTAVYQLMDYKRSVTINVTSRYEVYQRYSGQIQAFEMALSLAKKSYEETLKDYRLGLVTNLDVLTSLNQYLTSKRNSEKTKIQAILNQRLLEASAGMVPQA